MPSFAGVMPNRASSAAIRMSHANAISHPPPTHTPLTTAMVGRSNNAIARSAAWTASPYRDAPSAPERRLSNSLMSAPAEKWSPPWTTSTRASGGTDASRPGMADHISKLIALRFAGRSIVSVAAGPTVSILRCMDVILDHGHTATAPCVTHIGYMRRVGVLVLVALLAGCGGTSTGQVPTSPGPTKASEVKPPSLKVEEVAGGLEHGWDIGFLPDGQVLVTERPG